MTQVPSYRLFKEKIDDLQRQIWSISGGIPIRTSYGAYPDGYIEVDASKLGLSLHSNRPIYDRHSEGIGEKTSSKNYSIRGENYIWDSFGSGFLKSTSVPQLKRDAYMEDNPNSGLYLMREIIGKATVESNLIGRFKADRLRISGCVVSSDGFETTMLIEGENAVLNIQKDKIVLESLGRSLKRTVLPPYSPGSSIIRMYPIINTPDVLTPL